MSDLKFIERVKSNRTEFENKVRSISDKLDINPDWLMFVMNGESGLNHLAVNPHGGATGLIQIKPNTAIKLGTTTDSLLNMSNIEQLDYVYKYYKPYAGRIKDLYDLYTINFLPIMFGKPDSFSYTLSDGRVINKGEWKKKLTARFKAAGIDPQKKTL
jgi:hypothetical protein